MLVDVTVSGRGSMYPPRLLLDVNGTLTLRGELLAGVTERLHMLRRQLEVRLLTDDGYLRYAGRRTALGVLTTDVGDGVGVRDIRRMILK